jgi:glutathione reductase (NADPH)
MAYDYDLFTIGAGSGGVRASRLAAMTGAKVGVAEEYRPGGTCVVRGCIPKKYMVYASEYSRSIEHMKGYGWTVDNPRYDHGAFMDRMHREVDRLSGIYARNLRRVHRSAYAEADEGWPHRHGEEDPDRYRRLTDHAERDRGRGAGDLLERDFPA